MTKVLAILCPFAVLAPSAHAENEALGRLFMTPQQRQELDRLRMQEPGSGQRGSVTINGEVRSASGGRTRWINGQADWQNDWPTQTVPVGDSVDPATGERRPLLGGGRIQVAPGRP